MVKNLWIQIHIQSIRIHITVKMSFICFRRYFAHIKLAHRDALQSRIVPCPYNCGVVDVFSQTIKHVNKQHGVHKNQHKRTKENVEAVVYRCRICDINTFKDLTELWSHYKIHSGFIPCIFDNCNYVALQWSQSNLLRRHVRNIHNTEAKTQEEVEISYNVHDHPVEQVSEVEEEEQVEEIEEFIVEDDITDDFDVDNEVEEEESRYALLKSLADFCIRSNTKRYVPSYIFLAHFVL